MSVVLTDYAPPPLDPSSCLFAVRSDVTWITIKSAGPWTGRATVEYEVEPNDSPDSRQGTILVQIFPNFTDYLTRATLTITQAGEPEEPPQLQTQPERLTFQAVQGGPATISSLLVTNTGGGREPFRVAATTLSGGPWLSIAPLNGEASVASAVPLVVRADPAGLAAGLFFGEIATTSETTNETLVTPVVLLVSARQRMLRLSQTGLTFTAVSGVGPVPTQSFRVLNDGLGLLSWTTTMTTLAGGEWLSVTPSSGSSDAFSSPSVEVRVDPSGRDKESTTDWWKWLLPRRRVRLSLSRWC